METHFSLPKNKIRILLLEGIHESAVEHFNVQGYAEVTRLKGALKAMPQGSTARRAHGGYSQPDAVDARSY